MTKQAKVGNPTIQNKKAYHEYFIDETFEAGIVLIGTEVKSIRLGKASIAESYCTSDDIGDIWVQGMHVAPYAQGNRNNGDPLRKRKLLLHKNEIDKIVKKINEKGYTLIPLKVYFVRGYAKMLIGLARGKKLWDKRESIAARDSERQKQRDLSERY